MRQIFTFPFIVVILIMAFIPSAVHAGGGSSSHVIQMRKQPSTTIDREIDIDCEGHRMPSRPIFCNISISTGIDIASIDKNEIQSFEIYDDQNICIYSSSDELDFIHVLFSLNGSFELKFVIDNYILVGYISV